MSISAVGSMARGLHVMAAGLRARLDTTSLEVALKAGGLLDPALAEALTMTSETADAITRAGAEIARLEMLGSIIDLQG